VTDEILRDKVAIVGIGTTDFGQMYRERDSKRSAYDLAQQAFAEALADSGLEKDAIDGLLTARLPSYGRMADVLGLRRPKLINGFDGSGRMSGVTIQAAAAAIASGLAETVACVYGNNGRSAGATYGGGEPASATAFYDTVYGMTSPGAYVALMYERYKETYGVPDDALAPLAIGNRNFAKQNPRAVMQGDLTLDMYRESRYIAEPLRLFDYCLINDGAVALILTTVERARALGRPTVVISATAGRGDLTNYYTSDDFFYESCRAVGEEVYRKAGITAADIDCAQVYDNFTPTILFSLEGFGFCEPGTSWKWVGEGATQQGGVLPINTSGGHTSESYMQGWALHVEAVRQLRGEAGERQVPGCEVVQYMCASPIVTSHILRRLD
jgi:acetyl-CoA acetyltransferase